MNSKGVIVECLCQNKGAMPWERAANAKRSAGSTISATYEALRLNCGMHRLRLWNSRMLYLHAIYFDYTSFIFLSFFFNREGSIDSE